MPTRIERDVAQLRNTRSAAIAALRFDFKMHGFDVSKYSDDEVSGSILQAAMPGMESSKALLAHAFERLKHR